MVKNERAGLLAGRQEGMDRRVGGQSKRGGLLLLADAVDELVPAKEHDDGAAGDERAGAEEAARRDVALEVRS
jgi:hypothetical protein